MAVVVAVFFGRDESGFCVGDYGDEWRVALVFMAAGVLADQSGGGGAWDFYGRGLVSSARNANNPNDHGTSVGFRITWAVQEHFSNQPKAVHT